MGSASLKLDLLEFIKSLNLVSVIIYSVRLGEMYLDCKFIVLRSIWLGLVLSLIGRAVSDKNLWSDDIFSDNAGSDFLLAKTDEDPLSGQFSVIDDTEDDFFADSLIPGDLLADNFQSCVKKSGKVKAREQFCSSSEDNPNDSIYTESDGRILTAEEVEQYWCGNNPRKPGFPYSPVCSMQLFAGLLEDTLRSTLR